MPKPTIDERGLPGSMDTERLILGSMLLDSEGFMPAVLATLETPDFILEKHRRIFSRACEVYQQAGRVDSISLAHRLMEKGELESVDGLSYITSLDDALPRLPDLSGYLHIVRDASIKRRAIVAHQSAINAILSGDGNAQELLSQAEGQLRELSLATQADDEFQTPEQIIMAAGGLQDYLQNRRVGGLQTCIPGLNAMTRGLQPGSLNILAARTSKGKTAFALNVAHYVAARTGGGIAIFSQEMSKPELNDRIVCIAGGISFSELHGDDTTRVRNACNAACLPIYIRDVAATVPAIHGKVRGLMARHTIALVIVDYLQLLTPAGRFENRTQEVSAMSRGLKLVASELKIPFLVLSQLKRFETNRRPDLGDLRESGSIEQDANVVMFLHSERDFIEASNDEPVPMELIIAKQRNGPIGTIDIRFDRRTGRFGELTSERD